MRRGAETAEPAENGGHYRFRLDPLGFFTLAAAIACGILLGGITIPLPGIGSFLWATPAARCWWDCCWATWATSGRWMCG